MWNFQFSLVKFLKINNFYYFYGLIFWIIRKRVYLIISVNNNIFSEINNDNPTICNFESNIIRIRRNNKRNFFENKFKTVHNPKIKIMNEEENSSKSFDKSDINLPINKELNK